MSRFAFTVIILLLNFPSEIAAQSGDVAITAVLDTAEVVGDFYNFDRVELSPDGNNIAWLDRDEGICVYSFTEDETICTPIPWVDKEYVNAHLSLHHMYLDWSSDSRYLTFAEYPFSFALLYDSDIWIFDTETHDFVNVTDDQIESYSLRDALSTQVQSDLDYLPLWDPASNEVFFFRIAYSEDYAETQVTFDRIELWKISVNSATQELVHSFDDSFRQLVLAAAFSPDGAQLALFLLHYEEQYSIGIWVLDISSGTLNQVVEQSAFQDTDLGWEQYWFSYGVNSMVWLENRNGLVIGTTSISQPEDSADLPTYVQNVHYVDLDTGEVSALIDYDQSDGESGATLHDKMPRLAVVCDDYLIFYVGRRRHATIFSVPLPFDGSEPVTLAVDQDYRLAENDSLFATHNGRALLDRRMVMFVNCGGG